MAKPLEGQTDFVWRVDVMKCACSDLWAVLCCVVHGCYCVLVCLIWHVFFCLLLSFLLMVCSDLWAAVGMNGWLRRVLAKVLAPRGVSARGAFGPSASFPLPSTPPALGPWGLLACGWWLLPVPCWCTPRPLGLGVRHQGSGGSPSPSGPSDFGCCT